MLKNDIQNLKLRFHKTHVLKKKKKKKYHLAGKNRV